MNRLVHEPSHTSLVVIIVADAVTSSATHIPHTSPLSTKTPLSIPSGIEAERAISAGVNIKSGRLREARGMGVESEVIMGMRREKRLQLHL
jgi:hypothetical protein